MLLVAALTAATIFSLVSDQGQGSDVSGFKGEELQLTEFAATEDGNLSFNLRNFDSETVDIKQVNLSTNGEEKVLQASGQIGRLDSQSLKLCSKNGSIRTDKATVEVIYQHSDYGELKSEGEITGNIRVNECGSTPGQEDLGTTTTVSIVEYDKYVKQGEEFVVNYTANNSKNPKIEISNRAGFNTSFDVSGGEGSYTWNVQDDQATGSYNVTVTAGGQSAQRTFTVVSSDTDGFKVDITEENLQAETAGDKVNLTLNISYQNTSTKTENLTLEIGNTTLSEEEITLADNHTLETIEFNATSEYHGKKVDAEVRHDSEKSSSVVIQSQLSDSEYIDWNFNLDDEGIDTTDNVKIVSDSKVGGKTPVATSNQSNGLAYITINESSPAKLPEEGDNFTIDISGEVYDQTAVYWGLQPENLTVQNAESGGGNGAYAFLIQKPEDDGNEYSFRIVAINESMDRPISSTGLVNYDGKEFNLEIKWGSKNLRIDVFGEGELLKTLRIESIGPTEGSAAFLLGPGSVYHGHWDSLDSFTLPRDNYQQFDIKNTIPPSASQVAVLDFEKLRNNETTEQVADRFIYRAFLAQGQDEEQIPTYNQFLQQYDQIIQQTLNDLGSQTGGAIDLEGDTESIGEVVYYSETENLRFDELQNSQSPAQIGLKLMAENDTALLAEVELTEKDLDQLTAFFNKQSRQSDSNISIEKGIIEGFPTYSLKRQERNVSSLTVLNQNPENKNIHLIASREEAKEVIDNRKSQNSYSGHPIESDKGDVVFGIRTEFELGDKNNDVLQQVLNSGAEELDQSIDFSNINVDSANLSYAVSGDKINLSGEIAVGNDADSLVEFANALIDKGFDQSDSIKEVEITAEQTIFKIQTDYTVSEAKTLVDELWGVTDLSLEGEGTKDQPYKIYDLSDLRKIKHSPASHFELQNDIDASSTRTINPAPNSNGYQGFEPIGGSPFADYFYGSIDGNGHKIEDLYINRPDTYQVGFISEAEFARIHDLGFENLTVMGGGETAGLASNIRTTEIEDVSVDGNISGSGAAGLVHDASDSLINNTYVIGNISAECDASGLLSNGYSVQIESSYAATKLQIKSGECPEQRIDPISTPASTPASLGNEDMDVSGLYWDLNVSEQQTSNVNATGLNTSEMKGSSAENNMPGLDFTNTWRTVESPDSYPELR
jgi:hypothetical protein